MQTIQIFTVKNKHLSKFIIYLLTGLLVLLLGACSTSSQNAAVSAGKIASATPLERVVLPKSESTRTGYTQANFGLLAPLLGEWQVKDWQLQKNGEWRPESGAKWRFFEIQGGMALQDEWESHSNNQQSPGYGTHIRVYEPTSKSWQAIWLTSRTKNFEFYRGNEREGKVFFLATKNSNGRITRTVFSDIQANRFKWQMQWSSDGGANWLTVYKLEATRIR